MTQQDGTNLAQFNLLEWKIIQYNFTTLDSSLDMSANNKFEHAAVVQETATPSSKPAADGDYTLGTFLKEHILLILVALTLTIAVFIAYALNFHAGISNQNADWGTFGDFIGGTLNPIFGFISVVLLFYAVTLQRKELKGTKEALESQSKSAEITAEIELIKAMLDFFGTELQIVDNQENTLRKSLLNIQESLHSLPIKTRELKNKIDANELIISSNQERLSEILKIKDHEISGIEKMNLLIERNNIPRSINNLKTESTSLEKDLSNLQEELPKLETELRKIKTLLNEKTKQKEDLTIKINTINSRMRSLFNEYQIEIEK